MNLVEDNLNILKMYNNQDKELNSEEYKEYINYLNIYFSKDSKKDQKYDKEYIDGNYILINAKDPKKKIIITPSKFINIQKLNIQLKKYSEEILYRISNLIETNNNLTEEDRKEFENLKNKYILFKKNIKEIEEIDDNFHKDLELLYKKKIEKSYDLAKYFQLRKDNYIKEEIKENIKNNLIKKFSNNNNKIPSDSDINKIAKEFKISSSQTESLFKWIEASFLYILARKELLKINDEIKVKEESFNKNTKYMLIKKPIIEK